MKLFSNFYLNEEEYIKAQNYWHELCLQEFEKYKQQNNWEPWFNLTYINGTPVRDGNPIASWLNKEKNIGIRIIQEKDSEIPLITRLDIFDKDVQAIKELVIHCYLTTETSKKAQQIINSWVSGRYNDKEMNQRIEEIIDERKKFMYMAELGSGQTDSVEDYYWTAREDNIFNLQLRYWVEALRKFQGLYEENFILEEGIVIINALCSSLETLAGVNIKPVDHTPSLMTMYDKTLKNDKGWDLRNDNLSLFAKLEEMDYYHKNICKHINKGNFKREMLKEINYVKIKEYMEITQEIWLWILNKAFNNAIPENQTRFFNNDF